MQPLAIVGSGMVTAVGLHAASSCAAIRCALNGFVETRFRDGAGGWVYGSPVPLDRPTAGRARMLKLLAPAVRECLAARRDLPTRAIPLLIGVAETDRPGRPDALDTVVEDVSLSLGYGFHPDSRVIARGRVSAALAMRLAARLVHEEGAPCCVIAAADTMLVAPTLAAFERDGRLRAGRAAAGLTPGEAAAAVLVQAPGATRHAELVCRGVGVGEEPADVAAGQAHRAMGLYRAIRSALDDADWTIDEMHYRVTDENGEPYSDEESAMAIRRARRPWRGDFPTWRPADSIGEVGAAIGPVAIAVALAAARKGYAPGPGVLCHFAGDDGERAALALAYESPADDQPYDTQRVPAHARRLEA